MKLRDFNDGLMDQLTSRLDSMAFKIGFKEPIEDIEMEVIKDFLRKNYPDFSMEEITNSFELGISGKLGIKTEDIKHYQSFNIIYIAIFLNAYRVYREKILKDNMVKPEPPKELTPEESLKRANESAKVRLLDAYKVLQETKQYKLIDNGNIIYDYLDTLGLIQFTVERKKSIYDSAKSVAIQTLKDSDPMKFKNNVDKVMKSLDPDIVKSDAKRLALRIWLNEMNEAGEDLEQLIKIAMIEKSCDDNDKMI